MGRTVKPARDEVKARLDELKKYFCSLRTQDRQAFEAIASGISHHLSSITYANPLNPEELMQWSALIHIEKKLQKLQHDIDRYIRA